jgi:hypothetical protein
MATLVGICNRLIRNDPNLTFVNCLGFLSQIDLNRLGEAL